MADRSEATSASCEVHTRFEPSRLAAACLADAYVRLVPVVRWPLVQPQRPEIPGDGVPVAQSQREEEPPCAPCA
jgi:hypothetical protein